jgi:L-threonylcarbamoyladenylate synthase
LGADLFQPSAVRRIFEIKGRAPDKPLLVLVSRAEEISSLVTEVSPAARKLMRAFWPGPLTILFDAAPQIPRELTGGTGKIGIRLPDYPLVQQLVRLFGGPITGTSANLSGHPSIADPAELLDLFSGKVEMLLDGGRTAAELPSTVVDGTTDVPQVIREGRLTGRDVLRAMSD